MQFGLIFNSSLKLCTQVGLQEVLENNIKNARKIYPRFFQKEVKPVVIEMAAEHQPKLRLDSNKGGPRPSVSQL